MTIATRPCPVACQIQTQASNRRYFAGFVCLERRLIVEADGSQYAESSRDQIGRARLEGEGFKIVRFWNAEILTNPRSVQDTSLARAGLPLPW